MPSSESFCLLLSDASAFFVVIKKFFSPLTKGICKEKADEERFNNEFNYPRSHRYTAFKHNVEESS